MKAALRQKLKGAQSEPQPGHVAHRGALAETQAGWEIPSEGRNPESLPNTLGASTEPDKPEFSLSEPPGLREEEKNDRIHQAPFRVGSLKENHPHHSRDPRNHTLSVRVNWK